MESYPEKYAELKNNVERGICPVCFDVVEVMMPKFERPAVWHCPNGHDVETWFGIEDIPF